MTQFLVHLFLGGFIPGIDQSQPMVKTFMARTPEMLRFLNGELNRSSYFVGNSFTAAPDDELPVWDAYQIRSIRSDTLSKHRRAHGHDREAPRPCESDGASGSTGLSVPFAACPKRE